MRKFAKPAPRIPMFTPLCNTAAIQGRHFFGHVSESSDAPTAEWDTRPDREVTLGGIAFSTVR